MWPAGHTDLVTELTWSRVNFTIKSFLSCSKKISYFLPTSNFKNKSKINFISNTKPNSQLLQHNIKNLFFFLVNLSVLGKKCCNEICKLYMTEPSENF